MKRIFCLLLALVLLFTALPVGTLAAESQPASTGKKLIAITFDDGPSDNTAKLLDGLDKLGAKVTFFMVGNRVSGYSATVKRAYLSGHQIGCHSWNHPELTGLSNSDLLSQFSRSYEALDKICGVGTWYITRAPYGSSSERVRNLVGTPFIDWSVDTRDWESLNSDKVRDHIVKYAGDGAIVLLHDLYGSSVNGALEAMEILKKQGYEFVTVNELFRRRGVTLENGKVYYRCSPTGKDLGAVVAPTVTYTADAKGLLVTIQAQSGAKIYYNTNGAGFTQTSKEYTGPFYVKPDTTVWAIAAFDLNGSRSAVTAVKVTRSGCAAPKMTITDGVMTLSCATAGAKIYYSLDGSRATTGSTLYTGPVTLQPGTIASAVAGGDWFVTSGQTRLYYSSRGNVFNDVFPQSWYCDMVDQAVEEGLMLGKGGYTYAPGETVTRGAFVTLLYRFAGCPALNPEEQKHGFRDVPEGKYYSDAVQWAYENGIVNGYSDTEFRPNTGITREQVCKTVDGYLHCLDITVPDAGGAADAFRDSDRIAPFAREGMDAMVAAGILLGTPDGYLLPKDSASRAEALVILMRMRDYITNYTPPEPVEPAEPAEPTEPAEPEPEPTEPPETEPTPEETTP